MEIKWSEIEFIPFTSPNFRTHLIYVSFMKDFSEGLKITLNFNIDSKAKFQKNILEKKIKFIQMIKENLYDEYQKSSQEKEFAKICSIWIPIKSYYLIFNQLLILCTLINDDENNLDYSHHKSIANFRKLIKDGKISFNKHGFNRVQKCYEAIKFKTKQGDNLKTDIGEELRIKGILKKLCFYKFKSYCRREKIKNFRKKRDREKKNNFFNNSEISLFEFFYWYRIKTNYRDLSFLDQEIHSEEIVDFYKAYYIFTMNFYNALRNLINNLSQKRLGKKIMP